MKKLLVVAVATVVLIAAVAPSASAGWRGHPGGGHRTGGCVGCGVVGGLVLGGILGVLVGGALAQPATPPPPPAYVPPPACYARPGYWTQVPQSDPYGVTTYYSVWVPAQTVCR